MVRKPTIHIHHKNWKPPFDVAGFRAIPFSRDEWVDVEKARADLKSTVEEVMRPGFVVENPITHARGAINLDQHASPEQRVLLNRLEALERQVQELGRSNVPAQEIINFLDITAQEPDQWRFETYQEFIRRKLRENLWREREKPSSVKKSNE